MTEGLFVLITMFVAYVVYVIVGEEAAEAQKKGAKDKDKAAEPVAKKAETKSVASKSEPSEATAKAKPATKKSAAKEKPKPAAKKAPAKKATDKKVASDKPVKAKAAAKKSNAKKPAANKIQLRNPETGEVSSVPNGYRFYKRWIKEVMVKEGLLEKIYKNNELDDAGNAKIKVALEKLRTMDKYKA